jgi:hypothetical protein
VIPAPPRKRLPNAWERRAGSTSFAQAALTRGRPCVATGANAGGGASRRRTGSRPGFATRARLGGFEPSELSLPSQREGVSWRTANAFHIHHIDDGTYRDVGSQVNVPSAGKAYRYALVDQGLRSNKDNHL